MIREEKKGEKKQKRLKLSQKEYLQTEGMQINGFPRQRQRESQSQNDEMLMREESEEESSISLSHGRWRLNTISTHAGQPEYGVQKVAGPSFC